VRITAQSGRSTVALATDCVSNNVIRPLLLAVHPFLLFHPPHTGNNMGGFISVVRLGFPPKPTWGVHDIPDLTGKVILVTGAYLK
jgi:hypothetical protein